MDLSTKIAYDPPIAVFKTVEHEQIKDLTISNNHYGAVMCKMKCNNPRQLSMNQVFFHIPAHGKKTIQLHCSGIQPGTAHSSKDRFSMVVVEAPKHARGEWGVQRAFDDKELVGKQFKFSVRVHYETDPDGSGRETDEMQSNAIGMEIERMVLLEPSKGVVFKPNTEAQLRELIVKNNTTHTVMFQSKSTNPKTFRVHPPYFALSPSSMRAISLEYTGTKMGLKKKEHYTFVAALLPKKASAAMEVDKIFADDSLMKTVGGTTRRKVINISYDGVDNSGKEVSKKANLDNDAEFEKKIMFEPEDTVTFKAIPLDQSREVTITNMFHKRIMFKMKTNNSSIFSMEPVYFFLFPGQKNTVKLRFNGNLKENKKATNRFSVVLAVVPSVAPKDWDAAQMWNDINMNKLIADGAKSKKINITFTGGKEDDDSDSESDKEEQVPGIYSPLHSLKKLRSQAIKGSDREEDLEHSIAYKPNDIIYFKPVAQEQLQVLSVANNSSKRVMFKMKSNNSLVFSMNPIFFLLYPGQKRTVDLIYAGLQKDKKAVSKKAERFTVVMAVVPSTAPVYLDAYQLWNDKAVTEAVSDSLKSKKLPIGYRMEEVVVARSRPSTDRKKRAKTQLTQDDSPNAMRTAMMPVFPPVEYKKQPRRIGSHASPASIALLPAPVEPRRVGSKDAVSKSGNKMRLKPSKAKDPVIKPPSKGAARQKIETKSGKSAKKFNEDRAEEQQKFLVDTKEEQNGVTGSDKERPVIYKPSTEIAVENNKESATRAKKEKDDDDKEKKKESDEEDSVSGKENPSLRKKKGGKTTAVANGSNKEPGLKIVTPPPEQKELNDVTSDLPQPETSPGKDDEEDSGRGAGPAEFSFGGPSGGGERSQYVNTKQKKSGGGGGGVGGGSGGGGGKPKTDVSIYMDGNAGGN